MLRLLHGLHQKHVYNCIQNLKELPEQKWKTSIVKASWTNKKNSSKVNPLHWKNQEKLPQKNTAL